MGKERGEGRHGSAHCCLRDVQRGGACLRPRIRAQRARQRRRPRREERCQVVPVAPPLAQWDARLRCSRRLGANSETQAQALRRTGFVCHALVQRSAAWPRRSGGGVALRSERQRCIPGTGTGTRWYQLLWATAATGSVALLSPVRNVGTRVARAELDSQAPTGAPRARARGPRRANRVGLLSPCVTCDQYQRPHVTANQRPPGQYPVLTTVLEEGYFCVSHLPCLDFDTDAPWRMAALIVEEAPPSRTRDHGADLHRSCVLCASRPSRV